MDFPPPKSDSDWAKARDSYRRIASESYPEGPGIETIRSRPSGLKILSDRSWIGIEIFRSQGPLGIAAIRFASIRWRSYLPQNTEISPHGPCVRCVAIRIARLAFIRLTLVPRGMSVNGLRDLTAFA